MYAQKRVRYSRISQGVTCSWYRNHSSRFTRPNPDIPTTVRAIKAGADDFLTKPVTSDDLFRAIEQALAHHRTLRDLRDKLDSVRARAGRLTPREREVFELVVRGEPNKQIARAIGCTTRTVKAHRHNVMVKMQVKSLAELVSIAERIGVASGTGHMD